MWIFLCSRLTMPILIDHPSSNSGVIEQISLRIWHGDFKHLCVQDYVDGSLQIFSPFGKDPTAYCVKNNTGLSVSIGDSCFEFVADRRISLHDNGFVRVHCTKWGKDYVCVRCIDVDIPLYQQHRLKNYYRLYRKGCKKSSSGIE